MKRIFTYIAMLTLAVACSDELYGPEETPLTPDTAGSVEVAFSEVTDNSFKVTVTPSGNVSYYSYLVDASDAAVELDPETLYKVGYTSVAQGTVKYTSEAPSYTFEVAATPNTTYQVYAVAASAMGYPGQVVTASVKTTDTVAPKFAEVVSEGNVVMFTFSEAVARNVEGGAIKVTYYAPYSSAFATQAAAAGEVTVPEDGIQVGGNQTLITVPGLPTGCYWTIDIPEGAYVDAVGQPIPAYKSTMVMTEQGPAPQGFYGTVDYVELPMFGEFGLESFSDWTNPFVIPVETDYGLAGYSSKNFVTVTYESATSSSTKTNVYTLTPNVDYAVTSLGFLVALPEPPEFGSNVTINIPAGCIYDVYGNDCEAWSATLKYEYSYTIEDVLGTYVGAVASYFDGGPTQTAMVIEESDDPEKGNVMFTTMYNLPCTVGNVYATFNPKAGTLTIPDWQPFFNHPDYGDLYFAVNTSVGEPVVLQMPESGVLTSPSLWFGAYWADMGGYQYLFTDCFFEKQPETEGTACASSKAGFNVIPSVRFITE